MTERLNTVWIFMKVCVCVSLCVYYLNFCTFTYAQVEDTPEVQADILPVGAPATGFGNELKKMDGKASIPLLVTVLTLLIAAGVTKAVLEPTE